MTKNIIIVSTVWYLLLANTTSVLGKVSPSLPPKEFTHQDTLRGSNGRGRAWWDVDRYYLKMDLDTINESITGEVTIEYRVIGTPCDSMQIDLQSPMILDRVTFYDGTEPVVATLAQFSQDGNAWWLKHDFHNLAIGNNYKVVLSYHGKPRKAVRPPWDGGFSWTRDANHKRWVAVSCQGLGASCWWPCKDAQWDEPDHGMNIELTVPRGMVAVSNGRFLRDEVVGEKHSTVWKVNAPINNYDVTFYVGDYVHWHDTIAGEKGNLDLDFYVLRENEAKAKKHFEVVKPMLHCFEYWMGPYPFYEDGYKLVEAPYLGMEHQSAVAYGNKYKMGYMGFDRTGTGVGMNFDYIIVHESGHEWFGNSITGRDMADNWIHEGITTFSECLFVECQLGRQQSIKYCRGEWDDITNDKPIIGPYGMNEEGSSDMYDKGAAIMYMIRKMTGNDERFRKMLRGLSSTYYHKIVTTAEVENHIAKGTGMDLGPFFEQYLRTNMIPELEYYIKDKKLHFKFNNIVDGFTIPLILVDGETKIEIKPGKEWKEVKWKGGLNPEVTRDFLFKVKDQ